MLKILIADDEPLVQAGIKSMINWEKQDMSICAIASNGQMAYEMILEQEPDIVITDIKMPVMTGLELATKCYEEKRSLPVFIILTSYEEFQFAKKALELDVSDYLIKLELTPDILEKALKKAAEKVRSLKADLPEPSAYPGSISILKEQFFLRLMMNFFESQAQLMQEAEKLGITFSSRGYLVSYLEITSEKLAFMNPDQQVLLYTSCLQMIRELITKYLDCYVLSLDTKHFCILFFLDELPSYRVRIEEAIHQVSSMLFNYYSVKLHAAFGNPVTIPSQINTSYNDARQIVPMITSEKPFLFFSDVADSSLLKNVFNFSLFRDPLQKAFSLHDEQELHHIFQNISELFASNLTHYTQALDAAANILYLSLSLLDHGEQMIDEIFSEYPNGYRSLYSSVNTTQILRWLSVLENGICKRFAEYNKDSKNHIVFNVKKYIREHIREKLSLNGVADHFNISPSYLSSLFSRYSEVGFNDYVNQKKIALAQELMKDRELKIYELSDMLGYESAFYFSRVFKKITGLSPRDYLNNK